LLGSGLVVFGLDLLAATFRTVHPEGWMTPVTMEYGGSRINGEFKLTVSEVTKGIQNIEQTKSLNT
jgi:hypothetical protein